MLVPNMVLSLYMLKPIIHFFDRLEDKTRGKLSHIPVVYSVVGGFFVIMFWRAVWETIDIMWKSDNYILNWIFYPPISMVISILVLLMIGLMVSTFIGHRIIMSGLKNEKKLEERAEEMIQEEEITLKHVMTELSKLRKDFEERR